MRGRSLLASTGGCLVLEPQPVATCPATGCRAPSSAGRRRPKPPAAVPVPPPRGAPEQRHGGKGSGRGRPHPEIGVVQPRSEKGIAAVARDPGLRAQRGQCQPGPLRRSGTFGPQCPGDHRHTQWRLVQRQRSVQGWRALQTLVEATRGTASTHCAHAAATCLAGVNGSSASSASAQRQSFRSSGSTRPSSDRSISTLPGQRSTAAASRASAPHPGEWQAAAQA
jgi:hypothetical protein